MMPAEFLMESFMLSVIGGIVGIFIGLILSYTLCTMMEMCFVALAISGTGYLVKLHVQSGQQVSAGVLLYETLEGSFAPGTADINTFFSDQAGVNVAVTTGKGKNSQRRQGD